MYGGPPALQPEKKTGEIVDFKSAGDKTLDAMAASFVESLRSAGFELSGAEISRPCQNKLYYINDDLLTGERYIKG